MEIIMLQIPTVIINHLTKFIAFLDTSFLPMIHPPKRMEITVKGNAVVRVSSMGTRSRSKTKTTEFYLFKAIGADKISSGISKASTKASDWLRTCLHNLSTNRRIAFVLVGLIYSVSR